MWVHVKTMIITYFNVEFAEFTFLEFVWDI
jgi:hypothetical protein